MPFRELGPEIGGHVSETLKSFLWRRIPIATVLIGVGVWGMMAIWYRSPLDETLRSMLAAAYFIVCGIGARSVLMHSKKRFTLPIAYLCIITVISWWSSIDPSDLRDWAPDVAKRSLVTIKQDEIEALNVRSFNWTGPETGEARWENRYYKASDLRTIDLFVSYWSGPAIAHTIVSFGFADGRQLAFSIEIRRERGENYHPVAGFFKQYELAVVAADETDVVKVRTNRRDEDVYRYRIDVKPENALRLFRKYADLTQQLDRVPRFYNTLTTNCTTAPFAMIRDLERTDFPFDWRVLASGYVPDYLYDRGFIERSAPFPELRAKARITQVARDAEMSPDFSAAIRANTQRSDNIPVFRFGRSG